jgi:hypothetical protein
MRHTNHSGTASETTNSDFCTSLRHVDPACCHYTPFMVWPRHTRGEHISGYPRLFPKQESLAFDACRLALESYLEQPGVLYRPTG